MKTCPYCDKKLKNNPDECKYCGRDLIPTSARAAGAGLAAFLSLVIPGAGQLHAEGVRAGIIWFVVTIACYILFIPLGLLVHIVCVLIAATAGGENKPVLRGATAVTPKPVGRVEPLGEVHTIGPAIFTVFAVEVMCGLAWLIM